ncbi:hypothetical protein HK098_001352 [Nowakowskiella sp. JEL0407]|nr:hypothetical protein HK098_001352 [Nowakowskiella sp. JEL0407]
MIENFPAESLPTPANNIGSNPFINNENNSPLSSSTEPEVQEITKHFKTDRFEDDELPTQLATKKQRIDTGVESTTPTPPENILDQFETSGHETATNSNHSSANNPSSSVSTSITTTQALSPATLLAYAQGPSQPVPKRGRPKKSASNLSQAEPESQTRQIAMQRGMYYNGNSKLQDNGSGITLGMPTTTVITTQPPKTVPNTSSVPTANASHPVTTTANSVVAAMGFRKILPGPSKNIPMDRGMLKRASNSAISLSNGYPEQYEQSQPTVMQNQHPHGIVYQMSGDYIANGGMYVKNSNGLVGDRNAPEYNGNVNTGHQQIPQRATGMEYVTMDQYRNLEASHAHLERKIDRLERKLDMVMGVFDNLERAWNGISGISRVLRDGEDR